MSNQPDWLPFISEFFRIYTSCRYCWGAQFLYVCRITFMKHGKIRTMPYLSGYMNFKPHTRFWVAITKGDEYFLKLSNFEELWNLSIKQYACAAFSVKILSGWKAMDENINSKWWILIGWVILLKITYVVTRERLWMRPSNFHSYHVSAIPTAGLNLKYFWDIRESQSGWFDIKWPCRQFADTVITTILHSENLMWFLYR